MPDVGRHFQFIPFSNPNEVRRPDVQKQIRRHVMRDIGRSRRRKPRYTRVELGVVTPLLREEQELPFGSSEDQISRVANLDAAIFHSSPIPGPRIYGNLAVNLSMRDLQLIDFSMLFVAESVSLLKFLLSVKWQADHHHRPCVKFWISMGLVDISALYLSLAHAAVALKQLEIRNPVVNFDILYEAWGYYCRSISLLTPRLCDERDRVGEGVRATISALACYEV